MDYMQRYDVWRRKATDAEVKRQLDEMQGDEKRIQDCFYKDLEFGTAGQRGVLGAGTNCLNVYTVSKTTQGLADYLGANKATKVFISYDSRINSKLFAETAARVLAQNGITAYITKELQPTPFVSFGTREMRCDAGIMITASHNPSKFNGYKVYGADGCQITDEAAALITAAIEKVDPFDVRPSGFDEAFAAGLIQYVPDEVYAEFLNRVKKQHLRDCGDIKITYSPLNGTGWKFVPEILKEIGVKNLNIVREQYEPDGNFPTCPYPNPEKKEALSLGLKYAAEADSDLFIATDPDADRVGVAVKHGGGYVILTGNEMGLCLLSYLLEERSARGTLPAHPVVVKTIVTTNLAEKIAAKYGAETRNVLTGFKYIGDQMNRLAADGRIDDFIMGYEESCGYLVGDHARDKDAVVACMVLAECADSLKARGMTLVDKLNAIYDEFGRYSHRTISKEFAGASGSARMKELLDAFRAADVKEVGGKKVLEKIDLLGKNVLGLPSSNVIILNLEDNAQLIVRPSGTEPLIKFYMTAAESLEKNNEVFAEMSEYIDGFFTA
ncbi:MAG TPA: phospho-sugar mutase [Firmicutes bacterium]|nr:phospho-sugar mutase [Bacillota bacterium]